MSAPDFVAVGHVTLDRFGGALRPGGAALYAAVTAHRLGLSAGILTSHGADFPLDDIPPQIEIVGVPSDATTTFEHREVDGERRLSLRARARTLGAGDVPDDWTDASMVALAPVVDEVDPLIATRFADASLGALAQGWLREVTADGDVVPRPWEPDDFLLGRLQSVFLAVDDAPDPAAAVAWSQRVPLAVLTAGEAGALLFVNGQRYDIPVRRADVVDATGAGDVFAATFMVRYHLGDDPWDAAHAAAAAAALAVTGVGWSRVPDRALLDKTVAYWRSRDAQ